MSEKSKVSSKNYYIAKACFDPEAFVQLYRRNYDAVFKYCVHRLFDRETAKDITSEVFLKVVEKLHQFKGDEKQFRNWLYKIATNAVNNHLRKTSRQKEVLKLSFEQFNKRVADCPAAITEAEDKLNLLKTAILQLKPRYQTIITMRFLENMKVTEIAEVLGSSDGTVRSQLARALTKLRKIISFTNQET